MMACKCMMINSETMAPHVCLSWPKIVKNCLSWPDFLALPLLNGLRGPWPKPEKVNQVPKVQAAKGV